MTVPCSGPATFVVPSLGGAERATGIEPAPSVWKTEALPLSYARANAFHSVPEPLGHEVRRLSASRDDLQRAAGAGLRARRAPANLLPHTYRLHLHIVAAGCGTCHMIPGIKDAQGLVGPPLIHWSRRTYIAGEAPNTPTGDALFHTIVVIGRKGDGTTTDPRNYFFQVQPG